MKKLKKQSKIAIRGIQRNGSGSNQRPSDSRRRMDIFWENTFELQVYKVPANIAMTKSFAFRIFHLMKSYSMTDIQMLGKESP